MMLEFPPKRVFLDTSILQTLQDYGEYIYDGGDLEGDDRIFSIPDGFENVFALSGIVFINSRNALEFAVSSNTLREVHDRKCRDFLHWAYEMSDYWDGCVARYAEAGSVFSGKGEELAERLQSNSFGYLSEKDRSLIQDAVCLECGVFLTMERKLPRNSTHIERELGIKVMQPIQYWELLKPWVGLLP